jgi:hypothetical protein
VILGISVISGIRFTLYIPFSNEAYGYAAVKFLYWYVAIFIGFLDIASCHPMSVDFYPIYIVMP